MVATPPREPIRTYIMLTREELHYLEACINVADGDGEHAVRFGVDQGWLCGLIYSRLEELKK